MIPQFLLLSNGNRRLQGGLSKALFVDNVLDSWGKTVMRFVKEVPPRTEHFVICKDDQYRFLWKYIAGNGRVMAVAAVTYGSRSNAIVALNTFMKAMDARVLHIPVLDTYEPQVSLYIKQQRIYHAEEKKRAKEKRT